MRGARSAAVEARRRIASPRPAGFALLGPALGARSVTPDMDVTAPRTLTAKAVAAAAAQVEATVLFLSPAALANVVATSAALALGEALRQTGQLP